MVLWLLVLVPAWAPVLSSHRRLASSHAALLNRAAWSVNPWSTATNSPVPDERGAMDAPRAYSLAHHNVPYANRRCRRQIEKSPLAPIEMSLSPVFES